MVRIQIDIAHGDAVARFFLPDLGLAADASRRALDLLVRCLSRVQLTQFTRTGEFPVRGSLGGRYVIHTDYAYNVERIGRFGSRQFYCARPDRTLPLCDVLLAQKLALETDEAAFLRVANPRN